MKKYFLSSLIIAAIIITAAFTGCNDDKEEPQKKQFEVSLRADITSSTLKVANDQWQPNDRIGLYMKLAGQPLSAALSANVQMSLDGDMLVSTPPVMYPETGSVDFIAYYPYQVVSTSGELTIPVPNLANQTAAVAQEILYSNNVTNQQPTDATVALNFKYALAKVTITVEDTELTSADYNNMTARFEGVYTQANMRLADGTFQYVGSKGNIAMRTKERTNTKAVFEALAIPMPNGDIKMVFDYNGKTYECLENTDIEGGVHYIIKFDTFSDDPIIERKQIKASANIDPRGEQFWTIGGGKSGVKLVKELNIEGEPYWSFEYDNQNRISKAEILVGHCVENSEGGGESNCWEEYRTLTYTYTGNELTQLAVSDSRENYVITYTRNGNVITNSYDGDRITVNNDGYPIKYERINDESTNVHEYEYTNGNLTKEIYKHIRNGTVSDERVTTYTFDNKKSVFSNINTPKWYMFTDFGALSSTNNMIEARGEETVTYEYEYTLDGYPTKIIIAGGAMTMNVLYYGYDNPNHNISVVGVALEQSQITLKVGETQILVAHFMPANATNRNVKWESNNNAVAIVDNSGKVTAISTGVAVITVTTEDGKFAASCTVTVIP